MVVKKRKKKREKRKAGDMQQGLRLQSLSDLMELVKQHQTYMSFLKDCGMLTEDRKVGIVSEIDNIFDIIRSRSGEHTSKTTDDNYIDSDSSPVS